MAWKVECTSTARAQLRKLDPSAARRVVDFMDERVVATDPRRIGRALTGPLGQLWRYRVGHYCVVCELQDACVRVLVLWVSQTGQGIPVLKPGLPRHS